MRLQETYINPFTDFGFKKLFGTEPNKDLLMDFLNELIGNETGTIADLTYLPTEQLGLHVDARKSIYDIYCENAQGEKFIVELQKAKQNYFKDRSIYYSTFPIQQQAQKKSGWNFKLNAVYTIGILDFVFEAAQEDKEVFHHEVQLFDKNTATVFYDKLTYIYLEMPKFDKTEAELETHFDKWLYVIKNLEKLTERPVKLQEEIFEKLFKQAAIANYSEAEYAEYEESLKHYRDLKNCIDTAFDEGKLEGKAEGRVEGIIETAKNLKSAGVEIDIIVQTTGLSRAEIESL